LVNSITSIQKGDPPKAELQKLVEKWIPINKPPKWAATRRTVATFGALIGGPSAKPDLEEIDLAIKEEVSRTGGYGDPPRGIPEDIVESGPTSTELLGYVNTAYERELDVLDHMIAEAASKKKALTKLSEEAKAWAAEKTMMLNQYAKTREHINFDQIWEEGREIFKTAYKAQRQNTLSEKPFPPGVPSVQTAIKSMSAMVWFFDNYEALEGQKEDASEQPQALPQ
jgi:hypothetical protein